MPTQTLETEMVEKPEPSKTNKKYDPKNFVSKEFMIKKLEFDVKEAEQIRLEEE